MEGRQAISDEIQTRFIDNNQKLITAKFLRDFLEILNLSKFNLVDDDIGDILINNNNPSEGTLSTLLSNISNVVNNFSRPVFFVEIEAYDSNGGNTFSSSMRILSTNNSSASASSTDRLDFSDLGFDLRVEGGILVKELTRTRLEFEYISPPDRTAGTNPDNPSTKIYFYRDYSSGDYSI